MYWRGIRILLVALLLGAGVLSLAATVASAQEEGFSFAPEFYHVVEQPGQQVRINLRLENRTNASLDVLVDFAKSPGDPWKPKIRGQFISFQVREVLVPPLVTEEAQPTVLTLEIAIPEDATAGDYPFTLRARTADGRLERSFTVTVTVEAAEASTDSSAIELESRFPFMQGPASSTFEFKVTLRNRTDKAVTLDLGAQAPQDWRVTFKPSFEEKLITSVSLDGKQNQVLNVLVNPPVGAEPLEAMYPVRFLATSEAIQLATDFGIRITGTPEVRLATASGLLNTKAPAGSSTPLPLLVGNTGTGVLREVNLLSAAPAGWEITFEPKALQNLQPGEIREVIARLNPTGDAIPGDYAVTLRASSPETVQRLDLRVTVTQSTIWGWVGLAVVVVVIGGLVGLFVRLGRR